MSPRGVPVTEAEQAQNDLLAQLGLTASASPDDVDRLHEAASEFLASAPPHLRGWAHAQVAALDAAYLKLTDPVGLEGSALRSPTSPPAVVPGGPATPPARRDLLDEEIPAAAAAATASATFAAAEPEIVEAAGEAMSPEDVAAAIEGEPDAEELAALYASVTPSAHKDMIPSAKRPSKKDRRDARAQAASAAPTTEAVASRPNPWKRGFIALVAVVAVGASAVGVNALVSGADGTGATAAANGSSAQAEPSAPVVDQAKVAALMQQLQAKPDDPTTLLALADEFFAGGDFAGAATWLDKLLEVDPGHIQALLARGAVYFNLSALDDAERTWQKVVELEPDNQEAHYDLGFMYFYQPQPDYAAVQREWGIVIELDPNTDLAQNAKAHLDALVEKSMIPAASAAPGASGAPAASAAPSAGASASPGASAAPAASPAAGVLQQTAANVQFGFSALAAKANTPFTIHFANNDTVQHDIVIEDSTGKPVFTGALIDGGTETDYQVSALPAGTYTFKCSLHPIMTGTLTVGS